MGSTSHENTYTLPEATSPTLVLTHPTEIERQRTWTLNHREWGGALTLEEYLKREPYLMSVPLSRDGGMTHWILTDSSWSPEKGGERPILASCESIRKRVIVAAPNDTEVRDGVGHGIGSVFTYPEHRGRRYAGRMLSELGTTLRKWQSGGQDSVCSALWSDIGRHYYSKKGWTAFPSFHVEFPVSINQAALSEGGENPRANAIPITYENLEPLCQRDEQLLRSEILHSARRTGKTTVAFTPDFDTMRWHLYRDDFITSILFKTDSTSAIKGAIAGTTEGRRVWAIWSRNYHGSTPAETVDKNTLYILRLVIEPDAAPAEGQPPSADVQEAFAAVVHAALREAAKWHLGKIDLWNPSRAARLLLENCGLDHRWVDREEESIPSMMWYGNEDIRDVDWIASEKYCWC
ncbi:hypothetical protein F5Y05DRAFT_142975 [Hypoxylon sp. FL0543]|nr:hypothetical protein F5Y05DRAFT_142975 [Hypoxylon sp. FL0543]